jgi:hypothetical protein
MLKRVQHTIVGGYILKARVLQYAFQQEFKCGAEYEIPASAGMTEKGNGGVLMKELKPYGALELTELHECPHE